MVLLNSLKPAVSLNLFSCRSKGKVGERPYDKVSLLLLMEYPTQVEHKRLRI